MFFLKDLPSLDMISRVTDGAAEVDGHHILTVLTKMRAASVLLRDIEALLRDRGFSQTQFLSLMVIWREPERVSLSATEIAQRLDVSKPVLSKALANLENRGLLAAAPRQSGDGRTRRLCLTAKGEAEFRGLLPAYFEHLNNAAL